MNFEEFLNLPTRDVAALTRENGTKVVVFPINGTRRWLQLEYPEQAAADFMETYFKLGGERHIALYKLFFDHGIETLLTPIFGPDLLKRGEAYQQMMIPALLWIAKDQEFLDFYDAYDVRVHIYGDTYRYLKNTAYEPALAAFEELASRTAGHSRYRLFFGVCAHDPSEKIADIAVKFHRKHSRLPNKDEIVAAYYGEHVAPVDFFIGFDQFSAFDMPLIATGNEDLYFTISPSPYLDTYALRCILYDHLYTRQVDEASYTLSDEDWHTLKRFYTQNRHRILGVGQRYKDSNIWYPNTQIELLPQMEND